MIKDQMPDNNIRESIIVWLVIAAIVALKAWYIATQ
jgi:hypothetical protein